MTAAELAVQVVQRSLLARTWQANSGKGSVMLFASLKTSLDYPLAREIDDELLCVSFFVDALVKAIKCVTMEFDEGVCVRFFQVGDLTVLHEFVSDVHFGVAIIVSRLHRFADGDSCCGRRKWTYGTPFFDVNPTIYSGRPCWCGFSMAGATWATSGSSSRRKTSSHHKFKPHRRS